ncbi:hypothetical protein ACUHMQ_00285 [Chitinimonas sp. PSY-7]|uniref:hypothetical protein n=1 Tax=Chitinimonas sp. PSY-7 TaxID=3459088 RepID=UPI00403FDB82
MSDFQRLTGDQAFDDRIIRFYSSRPIFSIATFAARYRMFELCAIYLKHDLGYTVLNCDA